MVDKLKYIWQYRGFDNGISDVDSNGNPRSNKIQINPCVELNLNTINETIDELIKTKSRMRIRKDIKKNNLTHLLKWKHNLNNTLCPNKVLQLYQEGWDGRLYQQSKLSIPHLISTPNRIRKVLFDGFYKILIEFGWIVIDFY